MGPRPAVVQNVALCPFALEIQAAFRSPWLSPPGEKRVGSRCCVGGGKEGRECSVENPHVRLESAFAGG